jgi:hypothetical protein
VGLVTGSLHPLGVLLSALGYGAGLALVASVGVWLSLVSRNTLWATVSMAAVLLLLFLVPWVVWLSPDHRPPGLWKWERHFGMWGLNPLAAWWFAWYSWSDVPRPLGAGRDPHLFDARLLAVLVGLALQAVVAAGAWLLAWRRLRSTCGR